MCEQSRVYNDGDIVWVKLSNCWWPGEVHGDDRLPADMVSAFKKKRPYAIVKFFQEASYEYVKNINNIHTYCCPRRLDFIRKGLDLYQANHKYMEMFPADVATAERRTNGDPDIINDPAVLNPAKQTSASKRWTEMASEGSRAATAQAKNASPVANKKAVGQQATPSKILMSSSPARPNKEHEVRILSSSTARSPSVGGLSTGSSGHGGGGGPTGGSPSQQLYKCHLCNFSSGRMNLLILHSKSHSSSGPGSGEASLDSRRNSLTNRSSTSASTMTPTKRFSTTSSCSTPSPALSPVSSPPRLPPPTSAAPVPSSRTPGPASRNNSRPPKKRTKRMSSSTDERGSPQPPTPAPAPTPPPTANHSTVGVATTRRGISTTRSQNSSSKPITTSIPLPRRSRNRRRRSSSSSSSAVAEQEEEKQSLVSETAREESPVATTTATVVNRNVKLEESLLKDWSDDDEDGPEKDEEVKGSSAPTPASSAVVSPDKSPTEVSGRSSPIRCRNIPKKDRRDFVFEEFEPKISPNRTEAVVAAVAPETRIDVAQTETEEPIVQKKKKAAAIERLSQQAQEEVGKVAEDVQPMGESEASKGVVDEEATDPTPQPVETDQNHNNNDKNQRESSSAAVALPPGSCFDFDEDSPAATEVNQNNGDAETEGQEKVTDDAKEKKKIKTEMEAEKDQELLAEIGDFLEAAAMESPVLPADAESVSPLKAKLSDLSLPPKERGKRIFKSRNTINCRVEGETVAVKEESVLVETGQKENVEGEKEEEEDRLHEDLQDTLNAGDQEKIVLGEASEGAKEDEEKIKNSDDESVTESVPRKRRLAKKQILEETNAAVQGDLPSTKSPETKIRRVSSPDPIEQALKEVCEDTKTPDVELEKQTNDEEREKMEVEVEEKEDVATRPKINTGSVPSAAKEAITTSNGVVEKPIAVESSPVKPTDLLAASKGVQKVQIVQRVRGQDGSETTETMVAKISSADSGSVLTVAITQPGTVSPTTADDELLPGGDNIGVNGSAHQESPLTPSATASEASATPTESSGSDPQILAIPAETFDGPANSFYLCTVDDGNFIPIDNQPLYLDASNQLVPTPPTMQTVVLMDGDVEEVETEELIAEDDGDEVLPQIVIGPDDQVVDLSDTDAKYILTTGTGQQILLDLQSLLTIASGGEAPRLVCDGQEMVIDGTPQEILSSITLSTAPGDLLEFEESSAHDIIGAALTDTGAVYPTVSTAFVSETNAVQTIMSAQEVPSKGEAAAVKESGSTNLEETLAVIGVKKEVKTIPASLELPITITNPKIAAKTTQASIKSVYMTTPAVCGSKMQTEQTASFWADTANGHEEALEGDAEQDDPIVMEEDEGESQQTVEDGESGIVLGETTEFDA